MKFGIISDLHMEFDTAPRPTVQYSINPLPDVFYLCAGDIHPDPYVREKFIEQFNGNILHVLGNHDFYGGNFENQTDLVQTTVGDLKIAGTTLWTDLSDAEQYQNYVMNLADGRYIDYLDYDIYNETHQRQKKALFNSGADIFVTHHCPSYLSVDGKYKGSPVNSAFATELASEILSMPKPPKLWVHGHTHDEFDYMIGTTRVICHPRGYPSERNNYWDYEPKIVEL